MMNENIIDFAEYLDNEETESMKNALIIAACIRALLDVSQEINKIVYYFRETGLKDIPGEIAKRFDGNGLLLFKNLIERQASNLTGLCNAFDLNAASDEADAIRMEDVKKQVENFLQNENTRVDIHLNNLDDMFSCVCARAAEFLKSGVIPLHNAELI